MVISLMKVKVCCDIVIFGSVVCPAHRESLLTRCLGQEARVGLN